MLVDLHIRNYKSLRDVRLHNLPAFSVMVGANASGKSNFVDALDFLSAISRSGLAAAVRAKGGYENICFRKMRRSKAGIEFDLTARLAMPSSPPRRHVGPLEFRYSFGFRATTEAFATDYKVTHERLTITLPDSTAPDVEVARRGEEPPLVKVSDKAARGILLPPGDFLERFVKHATLPEDELLWPSRLADLSPFRRLSQFLGGCRVYQISPEMARKPGIPERSPEVGRHGENLPAAIEFLKRNRKEAFEELVSHVKHAVSTLDHIETRYVETKELGLFFKERGVGKPWYAHDVSDGTLKTVAMFLPVVDPRVTIVAIEEPENCLHPWILRHFIEVCKAHSGSKQVFLTTHSPVAVDDVPIDSLFIVRRSGGQTQIERLDTLFPEARQVIAEELFGLGQYWDSGAIGAVPESEADLVSE